MFLSCRPLVVKTTFSTRLLGVEVTYSQETEVTSTPTRPVESVVITTKGLQNRNIHILDGTMVENKGKTINCIFLLIPLLVSSYLFLIPLP